MNTNWYKILSLGDRDYDEGNDSLEKYRKENNPSKKIDFGAEADTLLGDISSFLQTDLIYDLPDNEYDDLSKSIEQVLIRAYSGPYELKTIQLRSTIVYIIINGIREQNFYGYLNSVEKNKINKLVEKCITDAWKKGH